MGSDSCYNSSILFNITVHYVTVGAVGWLCCEQSIILDVLFTVIFPLVSVKDYQ